MPLGGGGEEEDLTQEEARAKKAEEEEKKKTEIDELWSSFKQDTASTHLQRPKGKVPASVCVFVSVLLAGVDKFHWSSYDYDYGDIITHTSILNFNCKGAVTIAVTIMQGFIQDFLLGVGGVCLHPGLSLKQPATTQLLL